MVPTVIGTKSSQNDNAAAGADQLAPKLYEFIGSHLSFCREKIFGKKAYAEKKELDQIHFPIVRGVIEDFPHMRDIWEHVIKSELAMDPKSINVLMSDSPLNTKDKK